MDSCAASCVGDCVADVSVPCSFDGYKGANPDCRRYYDVSSETGLPASCASAVSCATYFDDHYDAAVYDPRMRPWYTKVDAATPRAWSSVYPFASEGVLGITAAWRFANSGGGVVGLDPEAGLDKTDRRRRLRRRRRQLHAGLRDDGRWFISGRLGF